MKANALGLIESLRNLFAEWKTVREALVLVFGFVECIFHLTGLWRGCALVSVARR